jgi:gas vesicle protein
MRSVKLILAIVASLVVGGLIGVGVALLYAPQSGRATRRYLRSKSEALKERALEEVEHTRSKARGKLNKTSKRIQSQANQMGKQLQDIVEEKQHAVKEAVGSKPRIGSKPGLLKRIGR